MVNRFDAYKIINKGIMEVADSLVELTIFDPIKKPAQLRIKEKSFNISGRQTRLTNVIVGHNLLQYTNKFYSISMRESDQVLIDYLISIDEEPSSLTGFGGYL